MRSELHQAGTLAWASFLDVLRRPAMLLTVTAGLLLILLLPYLIQFKMGEQARIMRNACLSLQLVLGWLVATIAGAGAMHRELRSGTAALALSKPVGRTRFFLSRFFGLVLFVTLVNLLFTEAVMISVRASMAQYLTDDRILLPALAVPGVAFGMAALLNAFRSRPFVSLSFVVMAVLLTIVFIMAASVSLYTGFGWTDPYIDWRLVPACTLLGCSALVACAMAFALSSRLSPPFTVSIIALLSAAGLIGSAAFGSADGGGWLAAMAASVFPDFQAFWIADRLSVVGGVVVFADITMAAMYAILYLTAWLCAGLLMFRNAKT